jgi:hypothetical protein
VVISGRRINVRRDYFLDSAVYCKEAEQKVSAPTLFSALDAEDDLSFIANEIDEIGATA